MRPPLARPRSTAAHASAETPTAPRACSCSSICSARTGCERARTDVERHGRALDAARGELAEQRASKCSPAVGAATAPARARTRSGSARGRPRRARARCTAAAAVRRGLRGSGSGSRSSSISKHAVERAHDSRPRRRRISIARAVLRLVAGAQLRERSAAGRARARAASRRARRSACAPSARGSTRVSLKTSSRRRQQPGSSANRRWPRTGAAVEAEQPLARAPRAVLRDELGRQVVVKIAAKHRDAILAAHGD